jgi:hypothetical protein
MAITAIRLVIDLKSDPGSDGECTVIVPIRIKIEHGVVVDTEVKERRKLLLKGHGYEWVV